MAVPSRFLYPVCFAVVAIAFAPCLAAAQAVDSISPAALAAGRDIFHGAGTCQVCHGQNLEGGPIAPTLKSHAWKDAKGGGYNAILDVVMKGVPGTVMVSHPGGISDDDARKVAAYVWAVSHGKSNP